MTTRADIEALGYTVGESSPGVLSISGYGIAIGVPADDPVELAKLADPAVHAERVYQFEHHHPSDAPPDSPEVAACPICNPPPP